MDKGQVAALKLAGYEVTWAGIQQGGEHAWYFFYCEGAKHVPHIHPSETAAWEDAMRHFLNRTKETE